MHLALRCEGVIPQYQLPPGRSPGPDDAAVTALLDERGGWGVELIAEGETSASSPERVTSAVAAWVHAGCTWWIDNPWSLPIVVPAQ
jgi:hypothetical protein